MAGKGLILSAPNSGSGKTVITLGILRALKERSVDIISAKSGPDYIDWFVDGAEAMELQEGGQLKVKGDVIAFTSSFSSDVKLKENIEKVEGALDKVSQLDGVTFNWKKDGRASAGVIAQNVEEVLPSAVKDVETLDGEEVNKHVDYNQLSALFIEAIKELKEENKLLKAEIEGLKSINS